MSGKHLHVVVDPLICQGTGYCVRLAPDIFAIGDDAKANVLEPHPAAEREELMEEAATLCPTRAITF
jgi:ferredoxin